MTAAAREAETAAGAVQATAAAAENEEAPVKSEHSELRFSDLRELAGSIRVVDEMLKLDPAAIDRFQRDFDALSSAEKRARGEELIALALKLQRDRPKESEQVALELCQLAARLLEGGRSRACVVARSATADPRERLGIDTQRIAPRFGETAPAGTVKLATVAPPRITLRDRR